MRTYATDLSGAEVIRLLRAEIAAAYGAPSLYIAAEKEYIFEENFDRHSYQLGERGLEFDLVRSIAKLTVEP